MISRILNASGIKRCSNEGILDRTLTLPWLLCIEFYICNILEFFRWKVLLHIWLFLLLFFNWKTFCESANVETNTLTKKLVTRAVALNQWPFRLTGIGLFVVTLETALTVITKLIWVIYHYFLSCVIFIYRSFEWVALI